MSTEGKRLNVDHTDLWKIILELSSCLSRKDNVERTHIELSELLGLLVTYIEKRVMDKNCKKREKDYIRNNGVEGRRGCTQAALIKA